MGIHEGRKRRAGIKKERDGCFDLQYVSGQRHDPTEPVQTKLLIKKTTTEEGGKDETHRYINKNDPRVLARCARFCMRQQKHLMTSSRVGTCDQSF